MYCQAVKNKARDRDRGAQKMRIMLKTLAGKPIEIEVEPTYKMGRIKELYQDREGIPPGHQRMFFAGQQLEDDRTVAHYNIQDGSVVHLVLV